MLGVFSKNFTQKELCCKCGCGGTPTLELVQMLQEIRNAMEIPLKVNSVARCETLNKKIGGAQGSYHMHGQAVDISIRRLSSTQVNSLKEIALEKGFRGMGLYNTFIHFDLRPTPQFWDRRTHVIPT